SSYAYGPLSGSGITSVVFEDGIADIPDYICCGATSLTSVTIPEKADNIDGYKIGYAAFGGCSFLSKIVIPDSITEIEYYAFAGCKNLGTIKLPYSIKSLDSSVFEDAIIETVQISKEDSAVALILIDNEIQYVADEKGIKDSADKYLNRDTSDYHATSSGVSAAGTVTLLVDYDFKANAKNLVSDMSVKVKLPSTVTVFGDAVRIDGEVVDFTEEDDGSLIIPVEKTSGSLRLTVQPNDSNYLMSYAQMSYIINGSYKTETIGIVNMSAKLLTVNVPNETSSKAVKVNGVTSPNEEVSVYVDDSLVSSCTASAVGNYSADVILNDVEDGAIYKIEVKTKNSDGSELSAVDYVTYNAESIKLTKFDMYYRGNEYDMMQLNGKTPVISWASGNTYTFIVKFNDNQKLDSVRVVSTKGSEVETINAIYDAENDYYVATGFYDYVPGTISVEYKEVLDLSGMEGTDVEIEDIYSIGDDNNINGYLTKLDFNDENNSTLYYYEEYEENTSFENDGSFTSYFENNKTYWVSTDDEWFIRDGGIFRGRECYTQNDDGTYNACRYGIGMFEDGSDTETPISTKTLQGKLSLAPRYLAKASSVNKKNVKETAKKINEYGDYLKYLNAINGILTDNNKYSKKTREDAVYTMLDEMINNEEIKYSDFSMLDNYEAYYALKTARGYLDSYGLVKDSSKSMKAIQDYMKKSNDLSDSTLGIGALDDKIEAKMEESIDAMDNCIWKSGRWYLDQALKELNKSIDADGDKYTHEKITLLEKLAKSAGGHINSGVNVKTNHAIDPSGYVYEGVKDNRISGVEATIYYKETEDSEAIVWDATEYDQMNPLYSDEDGAYAWDVPEGLWQVKFNKEGYETSYSEWLPVPPEQLEVNVEMISKSAPAVERINAYNNEVEIIFDQYVDVSTVNEDTVSFTLDGKAVTGIFEAVDSQPDASDSSVTLAKVFNFVTYDSINGTVDYSVSDVYNYAGKQMKSEYTGTIDIVKEIKSIKTEDSVTISYKGDGEITLKANPGDAAAGKTVILSTENSYLISVPESVVFDSSGTATVPVKSLLPGETKVHYSIEGTTLNGEITVISEVDGNVIEKEDNSLPGDVNGDGTVNLKDVVLVRRYIADGWSVDHDENVADVNNDGTVNLKDVVLIRRYIAGGWDIEI
ncbi:MAG: leucine-rich repeat protein, partial [Ruminococcus sp.]|nr:leucine-rich repeat protein [Ruminococcus sp.]